jgi:hypothetical protein
MVNLPLTDSSEQTPMERIFEKVMMRKMTEKEKEILGLKRPAEAEKKQLGRRSRVSRKKVQGLANNDDVN